MLVQQVNDPLRQVNIVLQPTANHESAAYLREEATDEAADGRGWKVSSQHLLELDDDDSLSQGGGRAHPSTLNNRGKFRLENR